MEKARGTQRGTEAWEGKEIASSRMVRQCIVYAFMPYTINPK